jgi:transposase
VPIGVFGRAADEDPAALVTGPVGNPAASACMSSPNTTMQARPGLIEVDLADGTRLRVDGFVNERALRRVLAVLKATA